MSHNPNEIAARIHEAESKLRIMQARLCLHGWATRGDDQFVPDSLRRLITEVCEDVTMLPDGMTGQECLLTVDGVLRGMGLDPELSSRKETELYLRRCYRQDGNWWLFGMFPFPPSGRMSLVKVRERLEDEVANALHEQAKSPRGHLPETAA